MAAKTLADIINAVSIVSIQADQSRHVPNENGYYSVLVFQSYQFRQINPDCVDHSAALRPYKVSIVSIQADQSRLISGTFLRMSSAAVSIVSIQADQSRPNTFEFHFEEKIQVSIVSIQADQSRPATSGKLVVARFSEAEWRNLFF